MIVSRTPTRLCLVGGGTDVSDFYRHEYGAVVTFALAAHVYVMVNPRFDGRVRLSGVAAEERGSPEDVQHPLVREALQSAGIVAGAGLDIAAFSEVPEGTGLGSSSALTIGLLNALNRHQSRLAGQGSDAAFDRLALAGEACAIEIDRLAGNVGKLDQYSTAVGGLLHIRFDPDETAVCRHIAIPETSLAALEAHMLLFHTGQTHSASAVMVGWRRNMPDKRVVLCRMRDQADEVAALLEAGRVEALGPMLHDAWQLKRSISEGISFPEVDRMYAAALAAGATGGKLCGAGGGGFLLVFCPPERQAHVRQALAGHAELAVRYAAEGTEIILDDVLPQPGV